MQEFFGIITKQADSYNSLNIGKDGITLTFGLRDSDKISEEKKHKAVTALAQKREEDYVYRDWINAAVIAYIEKRYDTALRDFSQALQYAKTKEQTVNALLNQGIVLEELDRFEDALQVYKQVDVRYGNDTEPGVREKVAGSLVNQGIALGELNHPQDALQVYKWVDTRYGKDTEPGVREQVAGSLLNQGFVLGKIGRSEEALRVYEEVDARYGKDTDPGVRGAVAKALFNQGFVLRKMGRFEEAIVVLRKAEIIFVELEMIEDGQQARQLIEQWKKKK